MRFLNEDRAYDDLKFLGKVCFDTLNIELEAKQASDEFCGVYFENRPREINCIEDLAALHSFKCHSEYNYPFFILSPNSDNLLGKNPIYNSSRVYHIKIPEGDSHESYSNFMKKDFWDYIPKEFNRLMFFHPDGFLIKSGWEQFVLDNQIDYIGAAWMHTPSIDILEFGQWDNTGFPLIRCGNGGFSYRTRKPCEEISKKYSGLTLRESGSDNKEVPEDLFYSHLINGEQLGKVASPEECMKFSLDPFTLQDFLDKRSFGFHYPYGPISANKHKKMFSHLQA